MPPYHTPEPVRPKVGPHARRALHATAAWGRSPARGVLFSIAVLRDQGSERPLARELAQMVGVDVPTLDMLLVELADRGVLWVVRRPQAVNRYVFLFAGERVPACDQERCAKYARSRGRRLYGRSTNANAGPRA